MEPSWEDYCTSSSFSERKTWHPTLETQPFAHRQRQNLSRYLHDRGHRKTWLEMGKSPLKKNLEQHCGKVIISLYFCFINPLDSLDCVLILSLVIWNFMIFQNMDSQTSPVPDRFQVWTLHRQRAKNLCWTWRKSRRKGPANNARPSLVIRYLCNSLTTHCSTRFQKITSPHSCTL